MYESGQLDKLLEGFCAQNDTNYLCSDEITPKNEIRIKNVRGSKRNKDNDQYLQYAKDNKEFILYCFTKPRFYYGNLKLVFNKGFAILTNTKIRYYAIVKNHLGEDMYKKRYKKKSLSDFKSHKRSKQRNKFYPSFIKEYLPVISFFWWKLVLPLTLLVSLYYFFRKRKVFTKEADRLFVIIFLVIAHVLNSLVCGIFANCENSRYTSRTLWLISLALIILLSILFQYRNRIELDSDK